MLEYHNGIIYMETAMLSSSAKCFVPFRSAYASALNHTSHLASDSKLFANGTHSKSTGPLLLIVVLC